MSVRMRLGARTSAAAVALAVPISMGAVTPVSTAMTSMSSPRLPRCLVCSSASSASPRRPRLVRDRLAGPSSSRSPRASTPAATLPQPRLPGLRPADRAADHDRRRPRAAHPRRPAPQDLRRSAKGSHTWTAQRAGLARPAVGRAARLQATPRTPSARSRPGCQMPWTLLAGIGRVESDHGRYGGSVLGSDGVSRPAIIGVALNGKGPVAAIRDTDDGRSTATRSGTARSARCSSSRRPGRAPAATATATAAVNPNDIDDAALAAAAYLCSGSGRSSTDAAAERRSSATTRPTTTSTWCWRSSAATAPASS